MDISAATAAYFFALVLDEKNRDLAYLGVVGGVCDAHDRGGRLVGENRQALMDAVSQGQVHIEEEDGREHYALTRFRDSLPMAVFAKQLTTLGAAGFNLGGPVLGVHLCIEGPFQKARQKLEDLNQLKMNIYDKALAQLKQEGFRVSKHTQWFMVGDDFAPMGVKTIGDFCHMSELKILLIPANMSLASRTCPRRFRGWASSTGRWSKFPCGSLRHWKRRSWLTIRCPA